MNMLFKTQKASGFPFMHISELKFDMIIMAQAQNSVYSYNQVLLIQYK